MAKDCLSMVCFILLAILLPPLAVVLTKGCSIHLCINIILLIVTLDIGAIIHAIYCVVTQD